MTREERIDFLLKKYEYVPDEALVAGRFGVYGAPLFPECGAPADTGLGCQKSYGHLDNHYLYSKHWEWARKVGEIWVVLGRLTITRGQLRVERPARTRAEEEFFDHRDPADVIPIGKDLMNRWPEHLQATSMRELFKATVMQTKEVNPRKLVMEPVCEVVEIAVYEHAMTREE